MSDDLLLDVRDLGVDIATDHGVVKAVSDFYLSVTRGEIVALVGESGSGKSAAVLAMMGLLQDRNIQTRGSVQLCGTELVGLPNSKMREVRGARMAMIFQDPMTALNPIHRVVDQIIEQIRQHEPLNKREANCRAIDALRAAGIAEPERRARCYPFEFSGGMQQRVMIAMALSCSPELIIADEPTTALDVTVQAQILAELSRLCRESQMGMIIVTHDLGVVCEIADRVAVMYAGRVVEEAGVDTLFRDPQHPYTWGLIGSITRLDRPRSRRLHAIPGMPPSLSELEPGCSFGPRCPHRFASCGVLPPLENHHGSEPSHRDRCWLPPVQKRELRVVNGEIALAPSGSTAA